MQSDHAGNVAGYARRSTAEQTTAEEDAGGRRARLRAWGPGFAAGPDADRARRRFTRLYRGGDAPPTPENPPAPAAAERRPDRATVLVLKRSAPYRALRPRIADPCPLDGWVVDGLSHFVFRLHASGDPPAAAVADAYAVFVIRPGADAPALTLLVHAGRDGRSALVTDLRTPDVPYQIALADAEDA